VFQPAPQPLTEPCKKCKGVALRATPFGVADLRPLAPAASLAAFLQCKDANCEDCRGNANSCRADGCKPMYYNVWGRCNQVRI